MVVMQGYKLLFNKPLSWKISTLLTRIAPFPEGPAFRLLINQEYDPAGLHHFIETKEYNAFFTFL